MGVFHTLTVASELQSVIFALDGVADEFPNMQRSEAVWTPVADCPYRPVAIPEEQNGLFKQSSVK
jgi:hypothetical protein